MPFATPLALLGLLFVPLVVGMYLLRLRRDRTVVPSTLLWTRLVVDVEANAPWQRLRRSLLLLLQLLLVVALALLAARPFLERPAGLARDLVIVIDASASMGASDVSPTRLDAAKEAALAALRDLPNGGRVSVIAAEAAARIVANGTSDLGRVRQAISSIRVTASTGDLGDGLRLASALAAQSGDAEILVATDAALARPPTARAQAPVRVLQVGRDRKNQAIVALAIRAAPSSVTRSVFIGLANLDLEDATRRLEVLGDGRPIEARDVTLPAQRRADVVIDDIPAGVAVVEVRLAAAESSGAAAPDQLAVDDRAWAIVPPDELKQILLVSEGDPYLETALSHLPNVELYGWDPDDWDELTGLEAFELVIFEGFVPARLPETAVLAIAPTRSGPLGDVVGTLRNPPIGATNPDEPVLRYVDLSTTHIAEARKLELPEWARTVLPGPRGAPLLYIGERSGERAAVLAFEPRRSDLPLQVAFPILLSNLVGELLGGSRAPLDAVVPGAPVTLPLPAGATGLRVERPDGSVVDLAPATPGAASVTFSQTDLPGVYRATAVGVPDPTPAPSTSIGSSAAPSSSPGSSAGPSASPSDPAPSPSEGPAAAEPTAPMLFAVDLFDVDESTIAPGSAATIEALGTARQPGASAGAERPAARDELWPPILLLALVVLMVEWAVYQRDALVRGWRTLGTRLRRTEPS